jgi:hypothetical protein
LHFAVWLAVGLMTAGVVVVILSVIKATFAYSRFFRTKDAQPGDPKHRAIAGVEFAYEGAIAGVICGGGILVIVLGAVMVSYLQQRLLLAPAALIVGSVVQAGFSRRTLSQLQNSDR